MVIRLVVMAAVAALVVAAPVSARETYGGIGATLSRFSAQNAHGTGTSYRITYRRQGRVATYQIVVNRRPKLTDLELRQLVTGRELPADARQVQNWKYRQIWHGYCAIYKSRWLGRALYGPYAVLYISAADQTASAMVSTAPACRG